MSQERVDDRLADATLGILLGVAAATFVGVGFLLAVFDRRALLVGVIHVAAGVLAGGVLLITKRRPPSHDGAERIIVGIFLTGIFLETLTAIVTQTPGAIAILALILAASGGLLLRATGLVLVVTGTLAAWGALVFTGAVPPGFVENGPVLLVAGSIAFVFQAARRRMAKELGSASREQAAALRDVETQRSALRESEQRFREIAEGVHEVFWVQDQASGKLLYVSPRFRAVWGRDPEDLTSGRLSFIETLHPDDREQIRQHLASGPPGDVVEYRVVRPDGSTRWIRDRTYSIGESGSPRTLGVAEDVTDSKALENRYRTLFHGMPTPAWLYDFDTMRILEVNDAATQHYGFTREEFLQKTLIDLRPAEDVPAFLAQRDDVDPHFPRQVEARHAKADGTIIDVLVTAANFEGLGHRAAIAVCQDVTDKNRAHEAARRNERLASLGTLVAGVAHEINNPLTYMRGNVELIDMELEDALRAKSPQEALELVLAARAKIEPVLRGMDQISHITTSLRQVARKPAANKEVTDIGELARGALTVVSPRLPQGIRIVPQLGSVQAEVVSGEISQILLNLLFNAADATASASAPEIGVRVVEERDRALVVVEDNGHGISDSSRERLFMPFHTTKPHGTGLGLAMSLAIAREHGGDLFYTPRASGGSTFTLTLPLRARSAATPAHVA